MRILSLTGGAGSMYCGSCLRDNALAAALLSRGHDVLLTPVYTPTRTDERNVSQPHVFFGGISVFNPLLPKVAKGPTHGIENPAVVSGNSDPLGHT